MGAATTVRTSVAVKRLTTVQLDSGRVHREIFHPQIVVAKAGRMSFSLVYRKHH